MQFYYIDVMGSLWTLCKSSAILTDLISYNDYDLLLYTLYGQNI